MELSRRNLGKLAISVGSVAAAKLSRRCTESLRRCRATWTATGTTVAALSAFDNTMKAFMQARHISAGQLAVTYQGRLVLARGYGDNSPQLIQPTSLFRVASLTKCSPPPRCSGWPRTASWASTTRSRSSSCYPAGRPGDRFPAGRGHAVAADAAHRRLEPGPDRVRPPVQGPGHRQLARGADGADARRRHPVHARPAASTPPVRRSPTATTATCWSAGSSRRSAA